MAETSEGHIKSVSEEEATLAANLDGRTRGKAAAPSHMRMEQLRARKLEIDEARRGLVQEYADINREIKRRENGGCARATARTIH